MLQSFRGNGSVRLQLTPILRRYLDLHFVAQMRAGTQTLIQALQVIPWTDCPDNDDDIGAPGFTGDSDSEEEDRPRQYASIWSP
jgi:hypothetical protein